MLLLQLEVRYVKDILIIAAVPAQPRSQGVRKMLVLALVS